MKNKILKKQIQKYLEDASRAISTLKKEMSLTESKGIDAIGRHGNSGRKSQIVGIQMLGTLDINPPNLKMTEILNRLNYEVGLTFKVMLRVLFYSPELGAIEIKINHDELRVDSSNRVVRFEDHHEIEGCPSFFQFKEKADFVKFKKILKGFYSQLGLKQKGIFLNVPSYT